MIKSLINVKTFKVHGSGNQVRDFIYVGEIVKKINFLLKKKFNKTIYNFETKKKFSINNIIKIVNKIYKKKIKSYLY